LDSFYQTSWNFVGISTVACGSFWGVEKIQNDGRCHGNQGAKNVKFTSNSGHHPTPLFWYLGFHGNAILNLINMPKASTHYGEYSYHGNKKGGINFFSFNSFHQTS
jgi:hypothetical protein